MPLFEAVQDKTTVVLDFGTAYTKCGFAGECAPRCIIPSEIKRKTGQMFKLHDSNLSEDELYEGLIDFMQQIYFRELLVNTKERKVVIVESIFTSTMFRDTLSKVLFKHFEVPSIYFGAAHILSLLTLGIKVGLIIDCGFKETVVMPVYHAFPIFKASQIFPLAGKAIHDRLESLLLEDALVKKETREEVELSEFKDLVTPKVLEDVNVKTCFVTTHDRAEKIRANKVDTEAVRPSPPPDVEYPLGGKLILTVPGKIREEVCEVLFEQVKYEESLVTLVLGSLLKCPIDTRKELAENILLMGGTTLLPGFKSRLQKELKKVSQEGIFQDKFPTTSFKFHTAPCKENYTAWLGGAIFGTLEIVLGVRSVTRETYLSNCHVPDWCCLADHDEMVDDRFIVRETSFVGTPRVEVA